jgi:SAM-dependent methyltransferase
MTAYFNQKPLLADCVLSVLRCLTCRDRFEEHDGELVCHGCGRKYPFVNGIFRFVDADQYAGICGFQWHLRSKLQPETAENDGSERAFRRRTCFHSEDLTRKLVLDIGCGTGRFADMATRRGTHVVDIDVSLAAEVAAGNLADHEATIFQGDVFQLPFATASFDYIYSIGLHHTPDCEEAFKWLPVLLKPGGRIAICLYSATISGTR